MTLEHCYDADNRAKSDEGNRITCRKPEERIPDELIENKEI